MSWVDDRGRNIMFGWMGLGPVSAPSTRVPRAPPGMQVAAYLRQFGAQLRHGGAQLGTGSRQSVGNGVHALLQAAALQYHHRHQHSQQGHADTSLWRWPQHSRDRHPRTGVAASSRTVDTPGHGAAGGRLLVRIDWVPVVWAATR